MNALDTWLFEHPWAAFAPAVAIVIAILTQKFVPPVYKWFQVQWGRNP